MTMLLLLLRRRLLALAAAGLILPGALAQPVSTGVDAMPRHVMLFISDGASWGTWHMASYHEHGELGRQPYDRFDVKLGVTTTPLNTSRKPTHDARPKVSYDPARAWDTRPQPPGPGSDGFAGYAYLKRDATDSAAAGTALSAGAKTYNNAINVDNDGRPLPFVTQHFKAMGWATGVVTSVPLSHATPAAFGSQSPSRDDYASISEQMIGQPWIDVLMGTGHPFFDGNGRPRPDADHRYISEKAWRMATAPDAARQLIQTREAFEALADGSLRPDRPVLGVPQVHVTLQAAREAAVVGADASRASGTAWLPGVPSLKTMTQGALQVLGRHPRGFFLMVEGGAVDWMAHANDTGRIIEEQVDFNHAVRAAVDWVERHSHWGESLIIVLTDHGNGMPMGPDSDTVPFEPVLNRGRGVLPGVRWHHKNHTNEVTLLWAHGAGAQRLFDHVEGVDPALVSRLQHNRDGRYLTNAGVARVLWSLRPGAGGVAHSSR